MVAMTIWHGRCQVMDLNLEVSIWRCRLERQTLYHSNTCSLVGEPGWRPASCEGALQGCSSAWAPAAHMGDSEGVAGLGLAQRQLFGGGACEK